MTDLAVELRGVSKTYPFFSLQEIDLSVSTGTILGLVGANGAGKSTTLRILMGLVQQERGRVRVLGHEMPAQQVAAKRSIGFVSEDMRLYSSATLAWHMDLIRSIFPGWDETYAADLLKRFDLKVGQKIKGLSHGQRVKATLLLALARRPRLLVLDEPTVGLDPIARHEVLGALMEVLEDEGRSVLFSSQNTLDVEQISDQITFIDRGRVVSSGDKEGFLDSWRRIRLSLPSGTSLPNVPGVLQQGGTERLAVLTAHPFDLAMLDQLQASGAKAEAVERMTLEEIFIASVEHRRQGGEA